MLGIDFSDSPKTDDRFVFLVWVGILLLPPDLVNFCGV